LRTARGFGIDHSQIDHASFLSSPEFRGGDFSFTSFNAEPTGLDLRVSKPYRQLTFH
jgi:hypothetical protein